MAKKPPKIFLKKYEDKIFNKKILSRTFMEKDKEFLNNVFIKDSENKYSLKSDLSKDDIKQLNNIAKAIKKNTGVVVKGKLIVFLVIIGSIVLFNLIFKDALIRDALKTSLESVFQAKSDIAGLSFDIFGAKISLSSCSVGDSTKPFQNLFELGKTEIDLNMTELLKGKFVVTNIECQDMQFGTKRANSAALTGGGQQEQSGGGQQKKSTGGQQDQNAGGQTPQDSAENTGQSNDDFILDIQGVDTGAIIEKELENLKSPKKIEDINKNITEMTDKWSGTVQTFGKEVDELGDSIEAIQKINIKKIKTINDIEKAYKTILTATTKVETINNAIKNTRSELKKDITYIEEESKLIGELIRNDYDYLLSFIKTPEKGVKKLFSSIGEEFLKANCGEFYTYGMKGIDVIKSLDFSKKNKEDEKEKTAPGKGYKLEFPGKTYPNFMIEDASFSIGDAGSSLFIKTRIKNISSAPDLTGEPSYAELILKKGTWDISFNGSVDIREQREDILSLAFSITGYPVDYKKGFELLGIKQFKADAAVSTNLNISKEKQSSGDIRVSFRNINLTLMDKENKISKNISEILTQAKEVFINASYSVIEDGSIRMNAESNIDELIAARVGQMIQDLVDDAKEMLKKELDAFLASYLSENETLYSAFKEIESMLDGDFNDVKEFKSIVDKKNKEIEAKEKEIKDSVKDQVKDKVNDLIPDIDLGF